MGEWLYRKALDHKCNPPNSEAKAQVGDIWQCDCGLVYRVKHVDHGDQRDPGPWLRWERYDGDIPKQNRGYAVNNLRTPDDAARGVTSWRDR